MAQEKHVAAVRSVGKGWSSASACEEWLRSVAEVKSTGDREWTALAVTLSAEQSSSLGLFFAEVVEVV